MHDMAAIRRATAVDIGAMLSLIYAHATFERTAATVQAKALQAALSGSEPLLYAWIAGTDAVVGYATATVEYSTFDGGRFVHLDCLFVSEGHRGSGIGERLLFAVRDHAAAVGIGALQWQTPAWNEDACRFYRRSGATESPKLRFSLSLGNVSVRAAAHDLGGNHGT